MKTNTALLLTSGFLLLGASNVQAGISDTATLYKNPSCLCCDGYAESLEDQGIDVDVVSNRDLGKVKKNAGIPYGHGACHTTILGDYVIEGHVPFAAVETLFEEKPDIDGLALAGMPQGTPGMPGPQQAPYEIMSFTNREASPFLTL
jgi:hypothetical protein